MLSKLLTFGAPGRFPLVTALPGDMPMEDFDLDAAKTMLEKAAADNGITREQGAEIFANVVNCMLIDIVDLASSALKEDDKTLVEAINIVVDYMNHAASLYDSVAEVRTTCCCGITPLPSFLRIITASCLFCVNRAL
jgi:hypothetical protein